MRRWLRLAALAWVVLPLLAVAAEVRLAVRETVSLEYPGASAAFAVDGTTVEAWVVDGRVVMVGRYPGRTLVTIVKPDAVESLTVHVEAPAARMAVVESAATRPAGSWEAHYDTGTRRLSTGLAMAAVDGDSAARLRLYAVREPHLGTGDDQWALPSASLELEAPGRSIVLLDQLVDVSPLTVDGTVLRGVHLRQDGLQLHAGIASATPWDDLLLPKRGDRALGLSYRRQGGGLRVIPNLLWLPDSDARVPGVVSLGLERAPDGDGLALTAELGWSGGLGAAFDLSLRNPQRQLWLAAASRPARFAALDVARPAGTYVDGAWSERLGERTNAALALSLNRLDYAGRRPEAASGRLELRHDATERWSLTAGLSGGGYREAGTETSRRSTLSLGAAYDLPGLGIAALYRYQQTSAASRGGHGGRLTLRGTRGGWRASLFVDAQQQAATLDLLLRDRPDLARAFAELGFVAASPEDVVRLVRENAALFAERGVEVGRLRSDPLRLQGGLDLAWRQAGPRRAELGLRLLADDTQSVSGGRRNVLATLYASWRIWRDTTMGVSYVRWASHHDGAVADERGAFQLALRSGFSVPTVLGGGGRAITGWVVRDEEASGVAEASLPPLAGVEIVLDRWRRTRTDSDGRFAFDSPGAGEHRVEAVLPPQPGAYFTVASVATMPPGGEARFAVSFSAARLSGTVLSDAGLPLAGVTVRLQGATEATTVTDSSGAYRFAVPAGKARVALVAESVPPGYELRELRAQDLRLAPAAPALADFILPAQRTLKGAVKGGSEGPMTVSVLETGGSASPDAAGRFLLRGLPAGPVTLLVSGPRGETRRVVEMPAEPGAVTDVELTAP